MADAFTLTKDDTERAKIVLDDALPYELDMLDAAVAYMQKKELSKLVEPRNQSDWHRRNATIESFWTHARCVLEFFNRPKNKDFTASSASARDFTEGYYPSSDVESLWGAGKLSETINEQISHVGFCRKAEQFQKLDATKMVGAKSIIDKEVKEFERTLKDEFRKYWGKRHEVALHSLNSVNSATNQIGSWKNY